MAGAEVDARSSEGKWEVSPNSMRVRAYFQEGSGSGSCREEQRIHLPHLCAGSQERKGLQGKLSGGIQDSWKNLKETLREEDEDWGDFCGNRPCVKEGQVEEF